MVVVRISLFGRYLEQRLLLAAKPLYVLVGCKASVPRHRRAYELAASHRHTLPVRLPDDIGRRSSFLWSVRQGTALSAAPGGSSRDTAP
jgi:hypothetical protein